MRPRGETAVWMRRVPRRVVALLEQGALSGANFLTFIWFARQVTPTAWGEFGFAYALVLFMQGFQRAIVTIPMIPFSAAAGGWTGVRLTWVRVHMLVQLACLSALAAAAVLAVVLGADWVARSLMMAAALTAPMFLHEFARRCAIQEERFDVLLITAVAYVLALFGSAALVGQRAVGAWGPVAGVACGGLAAMLAYAVLARRSLVGLPAAWHLMPEGLGGYAKWSVLGHLGFSGYNFGIQALLGAISGPAAVGVFHACRTLIQPVATVIGAMDSVDKPRAAHALTTSGLAAMRRVLLRSLVAILCLGLPYLLLVGLTADELLELAYRDRYAGHGGAVLMWCFVALGMMLAQPVESGLYVCRRTRAMFYSRAIAALIGLAAAVPLVQEHGAVGALGAMVIAYLVTATLGAIVLFRRDAAAA